MGIRIDITGAETQINYYGQKLYGYVDKETDEKLTSKNYLIEIGKYCNLCSKNIYDCDDDGATKLTSEEFKKFCELYADDLEKYYPYGEYKKEWFLENEDVKKLLETFIKKEYKIFIGDENPGSDHTSSKTVEESFSKIQKIKGEKSMENKNIKLNVYDVVIITDKLGNIWQESIETIENYYMKDKVVYTTEKFYIEDVENNRIITAKNNLEFDNLHIIEVYRLTKQFTQIY